MYINGSVVPATHLFISIVWALQNQLSMVNACNSDLFFNFQILFLYFVYNF